MSDKDPVIIFGELRKILKDYSQEMVLVTDTDTGFYLDTHDIMTNKKNRYFGSTKINRNYVSYYLMAIYENPTLLDSISVELKSRMQGKSCFNFKVVDLELMSELKVLTKASYEFYKEKGYL